MGWPRVAPRRLGVPGGECRSSSQRIVVPLVISAEGTFSTHTGGRARRAAELERLSVGAGARWAAGRASVKAGQLRGRHISWRARAAPDLRTGPAQARTHSLVARQ
jgi:hypothetical protein